MLKHAITLAAVAGLVFALAPAATAGVAYTEDFVDADNVGELLSDSNIGWTQHNKHRINNTTSDPYVNTPDGDGYYALNDSGASNSKHAITDESPISSGDRGNIVFTADWALNVTKGMKFLAEVGGTWYGSETFGTDDATNGDCDGTGVKEWVADTSVNADTGTWYQSLKGLPDGYDWRDGNLWDTNPLTGLPAGDITRFGMGFKQTGNGDYGAVDNFRVTPEPATLALLGLGAVGTLVARRKRK